jgi:hypothetical protein
LPVGGVPEEFHISSVRDDVIDCGSGLGDAFLLAHGAERVIPEVTEAALLPSGVVWPWSVGRS